MTLEVDRFVSILSPVHVPLNTSVPLSHISRQIDRAFDFTVGVPEWFALLCDDQLRELFFVLVQKVGDISDQFTSFVCWTIAPLVLACVGGDGQPFRPDPNIHTIPTTIVTSPAATAVSEFLPSRRIPRWAIVCHSKDR